MIKRTLVAVLAAFALYSAAGCSSAVTDLEVCNANCDNDKKCGRKNDTETTNCHTTCNNAAGLHAQADIDLAARCANANAIRQAELDCLSNSDSCGFGQPLLCQGNAVANCVQK